MVAVIQHFANDEAGATAVEYGLIAALVSVAGIGALQTMGISLAQIFTVVSDNLSDAATAAPTE